MRAIVMNAASAAPWTISADDTVELFETDVVRGLSAEDAAARLTRDGPNELVEAPPVPLSERVLAQFKDPLVALLIAAIV
ncbi:MAG: hypothetical protein KDB37_19015, partial [Ilumatobacter sp.]|nr:hypothetical protein [Ilumatobacter sp.]